jgi:hypothetical protein
MKVEALPRRWTKAPPTRKIESSSFPADETRRPMVISGEAIRMMNFVDDISTTLRRIAANIPFMTDEERKRLADYMKKSEPSYMGMIEKLEKGGSQ